MLSTNIKLKFYTDPGHGWVAVKYVLLQEMNLLDKISTYSFQKGATVYLEEDCDYPLFFGACQDKEIKVELICQHTDSRSPIRSYDRFIKKIY